MTLLQNIAHSRKFDSDTLKSGIKRIGYCKRITKKRLAQKDTGVDLKGRLLSIFQGDFSASGTLFKRSVVEVLPKQVRYMLGEGNMLFQAHEAEKEKHEGTML